MTVNEHIFYLSQLTANYNAANSDHGDFPTEGGWYYSDGYSLWGAFTGENEARSYADDPAGCLEIDPMTGEEV